LLGDTYFERYVDRLDLLSKWVVVPRLISGHEIDRGGRAYELLKQLIRRRNELMHPKSVPFSIEQFRRAAALPRADAARDAVEALDRLGDEAEKFDGQLGGIGLLDSEAHLRRQIERGK
jgi:hypothetical protein